MIRRSILALVTLLSLLPSLAQAEFVTQLETRNTDVETTPEVSQREFLLTTAKSHPLIQTYGVATCLALAIYHPKTKTGVLAHIDAPTLVTPSVERLASAFRALGIPTEELVAHLSGADPGSSHPGAVSTTKTMVSNTLKALHAAKIEVKTLDVFTQAPAMYGRKLELDLRTGDFYYYAEELKTPGASLERERQRINYIWFDQSKYQFLCDTYLNPHPESLLPKGVDFSQVPGSNCSK